MQRCCDDTSSDDDEHNTSNLLLMLCAHALVPPALLSRLTELDELSVALASRFALDIFTMVQQDYPPADQESSACSGSLDLIHQASDSRRQHRWTCLSGCALSSSSPASRSPSTVITCESLLTRPDSASPTRPTLSRLPTSLTALPGHSPFFFWTAMSLAAAHARSHFLNVVPLLHDQWLELRRCPINAINRRSRARPLFA